MFKTSRFAEKSLLLRSVLPGLVLFLTVAWLYWPSLEHPFNFDDQIFLGDENVRLGRWSELLVPPAPRFLTWLGFLAQYQVFGPSAGGFHAVSLILHGLNSVVVFWILGLVQSSRERPDACAWKPSVTAFAWVAAMFFALHPVQSESVLNIYQQSTLLGSLFTMLSLACWLMVRPDKSWSAATSFALVFFVIAVSARETAAVLPVILWVFAGLFRRRWKPDRKLLPFLGVSAAAVAAYLARSAADQPAFWTHAQSALLYAASQVKVIWLYLGLLLGLEPLNVDHHVVPFRSWTDLSWWLALLGLIMLGWAIVRLKRFSVEATFFSLVFFLFLLPTSSLLPRLDLAFEHRVYSSVLGLAGLIGVIGHKLFAGWPAAEGDSLSGQRSYHRWARLGVVCGLAVLLALCGWGSIRRGQVWSDPIALWQDAVSKSPAKYRPNYNLGVLLMRSSPARAEFYLTRAIEIDPSLPLAYRSLGQVHFQQDRIEQAERFWQQALLLQPDDFQTQLALGTLYSSQNDFFAALEHLQAAVRLEPESWAGHSQLARLHLQFSLDSRAIEHAERALALNPGLPQLHFLLGDAVSLQSNWKRAAELYEGALQLGAEDAPHFFRLGAIYHEMGQVEKARETVRAGLRRATSGSQRQAGEQLLAKFGTGTN